MTSRPYKLLIHRIFKEQVDIFLQKNPTYWNSLVNQCRKACADPFNAGKALGHVRTKVLTNRIHRLRVGGRNKHRLIYIINPEKEVILPVFLSIEVRANIDYDKIPWQEYADQINKDFIEGNADMFETWNLIGI